MCSCHSFIAYALMPEGEKALKYHAGRIDVKIYKKSKLPHCRLNSPACRPPRDDDADEASRYAERRKVHGDVGGAARAIVGPPHVDDGHRRLGRDAPGRSEEVTVEHHVAGDDDASR